MKSYQKMEMEVILFKEDIVTASKDVFVEWEWDDVFGDNIFD